MAGNPAPDFKFVDPPEGGSRGQQGTNPPPGKNVTSAAPNTYLADAPGSYVDREPVITSAGILGVLSALVSWGVGRNLLGSADEAMLMAIIPTVAALGFAYYGRRGVTSVGRAQNAIDGAYTAQPGLDPKPKL